MNYTQEEIGLFINYTVVVIPILGREMQYMLVSRRWREDYCLSDENIIGQCHYYR